MFLNQRSHIIFFQKKLSEKKNGYKRRLEKKLRNLYTVKNILKLLA